MKKRYIRAVAMVLLCGCLLSLAPYTPRVSASSDGVDLQSLVEQQIRTFADSIDQSNADDKAALALATHGIFGSGKKFSVDEGHALTATLWNSELLQVAMTETCVAAIEYMQKLDLDELPYVKGYCIWNSANTTYSAYVYTADDKEFEHMEARIVPYQDYTGKRNDDDNSLVWITGNAANQVSFQQKKITQNEVTYEVKCVFYDRFDFSTSSNNGFKNLISGLGALLFREFDWESTVTFSLTVPYSCTHSSGKYHWTYDPENHLMISDLRDGYTGNQTVSHAVMSDGGEVQYYYELAETVRLYHNKPWVLEYQICNPGIFAFAPQNNTDNQLICLQNYGRKYVTARKSERVRFSDSEAAQMGLTSTNQKRTHYYGTAMNSLFSYSKNQVYTIRLENVADKDGSNMVWLTAYNNDLQQTVLHVPMDDYYVTESWGAKDVLQSTESDGISGQDFLLISLELSCRVSTPTILT